MPPTLDDLAAQLAALGLEIQQGDGGKPGKGWLLAFVPKADSKDSRPSILVYNEGDVFWRDGRITDEVWRAFDVIRAWQESGARPEPVGAEPVQITLKHGDAAWWRAMIDRPDDWSAPKRAQRIRQALIAALAGEKP